MQHFHQSIPGWCSSQQLDLYAHWASSALPGSRCVEVGCWLGKSTAAMAVNLANRSGGDIEFWAVDHWQGSEEHQDHPLVREGQLFDQFVTNLAPVKDHVKILKLPSAEASRLFEDHSLDFVFLDAAHDLDSVSEDIDCWLAKLKPGGLLAGDDWDPEEFPGVVQAVQSRLTSVEVHGRVWTYRVPRKTPFKFTTDRGLDLSVNRDRHIAQTLIIALEHNEKSRAQLARSMERCQQAGQPAEPFWGYDGTDRRTIKTPQHLMDCPQMRAIKLMDHGLSITETACALSHIAAWVRCMTINRPVVILEHDSFMLRPFRELTYTNSIEYLGHICEVSEHLKTDNLQDIDSAFDRILAGQEILDEPKLIHSLTQVVNYNYIFSMGLHAYAIDPLMARRLYAQVLVEGLINPIDSIVEPGEFELVQTGIYASQSTDCELTTTIGYDDKTIFNGRKNTWTIPGVSK